MEAHLRTDHLQGSLKSRALSGGVVTVMSQGARFGLYMLSTVVLARLLSPDDFGLVTMVGTLTGFLRMFREAGLSTATIQKESITHAQVSNLFWINLALGAATCIAGSACAPLLAWYFRDERLVSITILLSSTFLLSGSSVQHLALLNRQMKFGALAVVDVGGMIAGLVVGVIMALKGFGYWALVWSQVATSLGELCLAWVASGWRPQLPKKGSGTRSMLRFGASLTVASLLRRVASSADALLVGRFYGSADLGLYSRGLALLMRPLDQFMGPFDSVFIPLLSRLQNQPERYRRTFLDVFGAIALTSLPVAGLLLGMSEPLVLLLLGPKWTAVAPIFASFTLAAVFYPVSCAAMWLLTTQARPRDILTSGLVFSVIAVGSFCLGLPWGPTAVAMAFSLSGLFVRLPYQFYLMGRSGPVSTGDLWRAFSSHLPLWLFVAGGTYLSTHFTLDSSPAVRVAAGCAGGIAASVLGIGLVPFYRREILALISLLKGGLRKGGA